MAAALRGGAGLAALVGPSASAFFAGAFLAVADFAAVLRAGARFLPPPPDASRAAMSSRAWGRSMSSAAWVFGSVALVVPSVT